jgi:DNA-binding NtrC family response regulator
VLDVRMRHMSGLELQERLAEEPIHPPIIIITGHGDVPMAVRAVKNGAVDFIEKPFNDQALLDAVHRAIEVARRRAPHQRGARCWRIAKRNKVIAADLERLDQARARGARADLCSPASATRSSPPTSASASRRWRRITPRSWRSSRRARCPN